MTKKYKLNARQQAILDLVKKHNDGKCTLTDEQIRIWATTNWAPMTVRQDIDYFSVEEYESLPKDEFVRSPEND
jgi:DeoR/GlpR family transcriptional regulator of sugar metabolism